MYFILGAPRTVGNFDSFIEAFEYQQKNHPDKKIIYSDGNLIEITWNPDWEKIDCGNL